MHANNGIILSFVGALARSGATTRPSASPNAFLMELGHIQSVSVSRASSFSLSPGQIALREQWAIKPKNSVRNPPSESNWTINVLNT
jgi:hypothetical protein